MTRPSAFTQRVPPIILRGLALTCVALAIPAFAFAVDAYMRRGAHDLAGTIASAIIGTIFLAAAFCAFRAAGRKRAAHDSAETPDPGDAECWSPPRVRWPLVIGCFAIAAITLVPAAIVYAQWRLTSGVFAIPKEPPPMECSGFAACGLAFLSMAIGLLSRRHRIIAWGLLLFLASVAGYLVYDLLCASAGSPAG